jgi:hypothetical protein
LLNIAASRSEQSVACGRLNPQLALLKYNAQANPPIVRPRAFLSIIDMA